jgi:hypothetical protein
VPRDSPQAPQTPELGDWLADGLAVGAVLVGLARPATLPLLVGRLLGHLSMLTQPTAGSAGTVTSMDDEALERFIDEVVRRTDAEGVQVSRDFVADMTRRFIAFEEIGLPAMQLEAEEQETKLAVWEVFAPHMAAGAKTWAEIAASLTDDDLAKLDVIRGDRTIAEVLGMAKPEMPEVD